MCIYLTGIIEAFEYSKRVERSKDDTVHYSKALNRREAEVLLGEVLAILFPRRLVSLVKYLAAKNLMITHLKTADDAIAFDNAFALILIMPTMHSYVSLTMHAFMPYFDHALNVAHAFATKLIMYLSLIILSASEFHIAHW